MHSCTNVDGNRRELIDKWIEPNPWRPGAYNVRIREYGVPVWALVGHAKATGRPAAEVAGDYEIPEEAAEAVFAYYEQHQTIIDARIAANLA